MTLANVGFLSSPSRIVDAAPMQAFERELFVRCLLET